MRPAFPSTGRLPSAISDADFSRLCSMLQRYYAAVRLLACSATASSPRLPVAARDRQATAGQTRSPRFQRDPSARDVASDPGRATVPRITAPHMLPSAVATASAPAISRISWLNPIPQTITVFVVVVTFHNATLVTRQALPLSRGRRLYGLPCSGDFSPGRGGFLQLLSMSLSPCCRFHPAEVNSRIGQFSAGHSAFALRMQAQPSGIFTFEATTRSLLLRPGDS